MYSDEVSEKINELQKLVKGIANPPRYLDRLKEIKDLIKDNQFEKKDDLEKLLATIEELVKQNISLKQALLDCEKKKSGKKLEFINKEE